MNEMNSVLAVLSSTADVPAARRAAAMAAASRASLTLCVAPVQGQRHAVDRRELQALAERVAGSHTGMMVHTRVATDARPRRVHREPDLVVVSADPVRPWWHWRWRALADGIVRDARGPVLVVRRDTSAAYARALVPVDLSPAGDAAVQMLHRLAGPIELHLMHVLGSDDESIMRMVDIPDWVVRQHHAERLRLVHAAMHRLCERVGVDVAQARLHVQRGPQVLDTVLHAQALVRPDLIVVGRRTRSTSCWPRSAGLAADLAAQAASDVLLVPEPATQRERSPLRGEVLGAFAAGSVLWSPQDRA